MSILAVLKEIADREPEPEKDFAVSVSQTEAAGVTLDQVASTFFTDDESRVWLVLVLKRAEKIPHGPITVGPGVRIVDVAKFTETTIRDLLTYVVAKNRGGRHWVERVLDEKLELLKLCGIKAEIRTVSQPPQEQTGK